MKLLLPFLLWASACLAEMPVGWPKIALDCPKKDQQDIDGACCRAECLYRKMFVVDIRIDRSVFTVDSSIDRLGKTRTMFREINERRNYRPIAPQYEEKTTILLHPSSINNLNVVHHEAAHLLNRKMGYGNCPSFIEEGQATFIEWTLNPKSVQSIYPFVSRCRNVQDFKSAILELCKQGILHESGYPIAGFFMMQIYDLGGPKIFRKLLDCKNADHEVTQFYLYDGYSEKEFWNLIYERAQAWIK